MVPFSVTHEGPPKPVQLRVSTVIVTEASTEFKGTPSGNPVDFRTAKPVKEYDQVGTITPCESIYLLPNGTIVTVRLDPVRARRYADHAPDGDPIIQFDNVIQILVAAPMGAVRPMGVPLGIQPSQPSAPAKV
jgi:hypothetical protein